MAKSSIPRSVRTQVRELLKSLSTDIPPIPRSKSYDKTWRQWNERASAWNAKVDTPRSILARARTHGIKASKTGAGVARRAVIADTFVIKFSRFGNDQERLIAEAKFIQDMRNAGGFPDNFPETHVVKAPGVTALVQEKIDMNHAWVNRKGYLERRQILNRVEQLARDLRISDLHDGNFGWRVVDGEKVPVFVDVDYRNSDYNDGWGDPSDSESYHSDY